MRADYRADALIVVQAVCEIIGVTRGSASISPHTSDTNLQSFSYRISLFAFFCCTIFPVRPRHFFPSISLPIIALGLFAAVLQIPPGFSPLFDGHTLSGWHVSRTDHHGSTPNATARDGLLSLSQAPYGQGGLLLTDKKYANFELYLEVKPAQGCNSGIFLRSTEGGSAYQIELDQGRGTGDLLGENLELSVGARAARLPQVWKNDDWNSFRIRMQGASPHLTEWVNNVQMWDVREPRNDKVAGETSGMIGLQAHWVSLYEPAADSFNLPGSWRPEAAYQFRNIAIRELP